MACTTDRLQIRFCRPVMPTFGFKRDEIAETICGVYGCSELANHESEANVMGLTLRLDKMTVRDKLQALEEIWDDLCRSAKAIPSPSWHADVLRAREKRILQGSSRFTDWAEAKRKIKRRAR